jgi:hypothetical protein
MNLRRAAMKLPSASILTIWSRVARRLVIARWLTIPQSAMIAASMLVKVKKMAPTFMGYL